MIVQNHPAFEQPQDENEKVWRYLDFKKFVDLLESSELFFPRADKFDDKFEGTYPESIVESRKKRPRLSPHIPSM